MRDIALMPKRDILQTNDTIRSNHSGYSTDAFRDNWIALMRHRAGTFLSFRKTFLRLANLSALPVANIERKLFQRRCDDRKCGQVLSVDISLDDLGGNRSRLQSKTSADTFLNRWIEMRERSDRATDLSHGDCLPSSHQAFLIAPHFVEPKRER